MSELSDFIERDSASLEEGQRWVLSIDDDALGAADAVASTFSAFLPAFETHSLIWERAARLAEWRGSHNMTKKEAHTFLKNATLIGDVEGPDHAAAAKKDLEAAIADDARHQLLERIDRDYLFGVTDLLKNRIASATGYFRLQTESIALLSLIQRTPSVGIYRLRSAGAQPAADFYKQHHGSIRTEMKRLGFDFYYGLASEMAVHSRVGGVAFAFLAPSKNGSIDHRAARKAYRDVNTPPMFFLFYANFLRFHQRLAFAIPTVLPEIPQTAIHGMGLSELKDRIDSLFDTLWPHLRQMGYLS